MNRSAKGTNPPDPDGPRQLFDKQVYRIVRSIPEGRVMTYGQVAALISPPPGIDPLAYRRIRARWVGYALADCPVDVPWQRVINQKGEASHRTSGGHWLQAALLEAEGVAMSGPGLIDLERAHWHPDEELLRSPRDTNVPGDGSSEEKHRRGETPTMNAYIAAGAIPQEDDPLFPFTNGEPKAMLEVAGKPMVQWVLDALNGAESIEKIGLVGLDEQHGLQSRKPLTFIPDQGDLLYNTLAGLSWAREVDPHAGYALFCSADIPAITAEAVQWRVQAAMERIPFDMDYAVVERSAMEARFPGSNRSYVAFRDAQVCGADMNLLRVDMAVRQDFWRKMARARKSAWRQAALFGADLLLLLLLRRLTLAQAEVRASQRLGLIGHLQLSPYPELAMDVDKPHQLKILQKSMGHDIKEIE